MIPFEEAFDIVMKTARPLEAEPVELREALARVLAEDVCSDVDMPPFDKSAMDGYACRREDLVLDLEIIETVQAGKTPTMTVGKGQCTKIMTGAQVPPGADCVIMVEQTELVAGGLVRFTKRETRDHICRQGEDIRKGARVVPKGTLLAPQHIAVLASAGCAQPRVSRRPRVGVIATGDELIEPGQPLGPAQIRTSNSYQLFSHVQTAGSVPTYYGIARDTEADIDSALKCAIAGNDVVILSGGVSMGDFDLVPRVMVNNNIRILFDSIAMKPGKPTTFGVSPDIYCFGLPGNPVSTFIQFEILIKPFLFRLMGHEFRPPFSVLPLAEPLRHGRSDREMWVPVVLTDEGVRPIEYHGSAHVNALCKADGLIVVPAGASLEKGTAVRVRPI